MSKWLKIETAPKDGTLFLAWAPGREGLPEMFSLCAWHPAAGFCIDEVREATHWQPLPEPPKVEVEPCSRCRGTRGLPCPVCLGAGEVVVMADLRVWCIYCSRGERVLAAARTQKEAAKILGVSMYYLKKYGMETGNLEDMELAKRTPGVACEGVKRG